MYNWVVVIKLLIVMQALATQNMFETSTEQVIIKLTLTTISVYLCQD